MRSYRRQSRMLPELAAIGDNFVDEPCYQDRYLTANSRRVSRLNGSWFLHGSWEMPLRAGISGEWRNF